MKQFKRLAASLLVAVMALAIFTACGSVREKLEVVEQPEKKAVAISTIEKLSDEVPALKELKLDSKMENAAKNGLEPALAYKKGAFPSQLAFALEMSRVTGIDIFELEKIYNENRYVGFSIPESQFSEATLKARLKSSIPQNVTKYGIAVATYEGNTYVAMFFE